MSPIAPVQAEGGSRRRRPGALHGWLPFAVALCLISCSIAPAAPPPDKSTQDALNEIDAAAPTSAPKRAATTTATAPPSAAPAINRAPPPEPPQSIAWL